MYLYTYIIYIYGILKYSVGIPMILAEYNINQVIYNNCVVIINVGLLPLGIHLETHILIIHI